MGVANTPREQPRGACGSCLPAFWPSLGREAQQEEGLTNSALCTYGKMVRMRVYVGVRASRVGMCQHVAFHQTYHRIHIAFHQTYHRMPCGDTADCYVWATRSSAWQTWAWGNGEEAIPGALRSAPGWQALRRLSLVQEAWRTRP